MILTMNARRFQRTHHLTGMGSSLNASKDIGMGVSGFALTCGSEPVVDAVCPAVVGSRRTGRLLDAGSDREDRFSAVCYVGDTRLSFCEKDDDSILHIHHLCRIVSHRNKEVDVRNPS